MTTPNEWQAVLEAVGRLEQRFEARLEEIEKRFERPGITIEQMFTFYNDRAVGTKEFRNFLAKVDPIFAEVRDPDVDNEIDDNARRIALALQEQQDSGGLQIVNKAGEVVPQ